jgi:hypothetical protein
MLRLRRPASPGRLLWFPSLVFDDVAFSRAPLRQLVYRSKGGLMASRFADLLCKDVATALRKKNIAGTMPAEMKIIQQAIAARLTDRKTMQALMAEVLEQKTVSIVVK